MPVTLTVKTSKGYHHYFRLPDDGKKYGNKSFKKLGYDIRGDGGYVVAPWSKHPDGAIYKIVNDAELANAPEWLLDLALKEKTSGTHTTSAPRKVAIPEPIALPDEIKTPLKHERLIEKGAKRGERSDLIWYLLNDLVEDRYSDDEIRYIFEKHPSGIGEKYFEKGSSRVTWLQDQIEKVREKHKEKYADPVKAKNQKAVEILVQDILTTFQKEHKLTVSEAQEDAIEKVVNFFIAMFEGSVTGWYSIPLPVGAGKTQTILHFIKFLYNHDPSRSFPISVAFEKITEIEDAAQWLTDHGVPDDYFQVVHHQVTDAKEAFKKLKDAPVILHTHYKLKGSSYLDDYFSYKGQPRKLLVFDESMLNSMISSDLTKTVVSRIERFLREYDLDENFRQKIPAGIYQFFKELRDLINTKEAELRAGTSKEITLPVNTSHLDLLDYPRLVSTARIMEAKLGENDLFRDLLLIGIVPENLRTFSLIMEKGKPALFACKEQLSDAVENLITTDASREFRRLFKYTNRDDGKRIHIYDVENFRWDDELYIKGFQLPSGQGKIKKAFVDGEDKDNKYLSKIVNIVKMHNDHEDRETAMDGGILAGKRKYLFFHSKQITALSYQVKLRLIQEGLIPPEEADERLNFVTFGRENATNEYKDCDVVVFIGLHHKPAHAIKALLSGEGFTGDAESVKRDVETGELIQQLQQGIGRGQMRQGKRQYVHFFHPNPMIFADDLEKAFPLCEYVGSTTGLLTDEEAEAMAQGQW